MIVTDVTVNISLVLAFLTVTICGALVVPTVWLPKLRVGGDTAAMVPVPLSEAVCVPRLPAIWRAPLLGPEPVGVNVTFTWQVTPGLSVAPQVVLETVKSPVALMFVNVAATVPVFLTAICCEVLVVPTNWTG